MKVLILCTGNSCRSQMAHGFLQSFDSDINVFSAGTKPVERVNPSAVKVMQEEGIDISWHTPHNVEEYLNESWDYVITVCGGANESCPAFVGKVGHRIHIGFDDPPKMAKELADKGASEEEQLECYRKVRDEIKAFVQTLPEALNQ